MKSITYGDVNLSEIALIIKDFSEKHKDKKINVVIGTDSQNFDITKIVLVIAVYADGNGGIFFYDISSVKRINNIKEKLVTETHKSLDCAEKLLSELDILWDKYNFDYTELNFSIHVDAGYNGPTKMVIPEIVSWVESSGYNCKIKPHSIVASTIADKYSK